MGLKIRQGKPSDSSQIADIYRPIVENTVISFEIAPPSGDEITRRIHSSLQSHEWLVAEDNDHLLGYAYATQYRSREAYRYSAETTVYVRENCRGRGIGRRLYTSLLESLHSLAYRRAFAAITLPNDASIALHRAVGFESIGNFKEAGFKFDDWHDVSWWQRRIDHSE